MADDRRKPPAGKSKRQTEQDEPSSARSGKRPANSAPDAVMDPNEKTDGKPGVPPKTPGNDVDPGAG